MVKKCAPSSMQEAGVKKNTDMIYVKVFFINGNRSFQPMCPFGPGVLTKTTKACFQCPRTQEVASRYSKVSCARTP